MRFTVAHYSTYIHIYPADPAAACYSIQPRAPTTKLAKRVQNVFVRVFFAFLQVVSSFLGPNAFWQAARAQHVYANPTQRIKNTGHASFAAAQRLPALIYTLERAYVLIAVLCITGSQNHSPVFGRTRKSRGNDVRDIAFRMFAPRSRFASLGGFCLLGHAEICPVRFARAARNTNAVSRAVYTYMMFCMRTKCCYVSISHLAAPRVRAFAGIVKRYRCFALALARA